MGEDKARIIGALATIKNPLLISLESVVPSLSRDRAGGCVDQQALSIHSWVYNHRKA